jgi:hypothetical protein
MCFAWVLKEEKLTFSIEEKIKEGDAYFILYGWEGEESELGAGRRGGSEARHVKMENGWFERVVGLHDLFLIEIKTSIKLYTLIIPSLL